MLLGALILLLLGLLVAASFADARDARGPTLLLFLALLPLLNALADFGSTGATRAFLRRGLAGQPWKWALIDLGVGMGVFLALGAAIILSVQVVIWLGGPALIDLPLLLADAATEGSLLNAPERYYWLYFTFLSTLLPTFAHLVIWLLSFATTAPGVMRRGIARLLEAGGDGRKGAGRIGLNMLCLAISAAVTGACALVWYGYQGLVLAFPHFGAGLVAMFSWIAQSMGAIP